MVVRRAVAPSPNVFARSRPEGPLRSSVDVTSLQALARLRGVETVGGALHLEGLAVDPQDLDAVATLRRIGGALTIQGLRER